MKFIYMGKAIIKPVKSPLHFIRYHVNTRRIVFDSQEVFGLEITIYKDYIQI
jgi:hypothetical protein